MKPIINRTARVLVPIIVVAGWGLLATPLSLAQQTAETLKEQLVGTWKLVAYRAQRVGQKEWRETLGPDPKGYAAFTREGRYMHVLVAGGRKPPTNDADRAALLKSMTAWSGRYTVVARDELHILVDTSWSEGHRGERQTQVRFANINGDRLILRTPPQIGARAVTRTDTPHQSVTEFVFEREK